MSDELRKIVAQYQGKCVDCGESIEPGDDVYWDPSSKDTYCAWCGEDATG